MPLPLLCALLLPGMLTQCETLPSKQSAIHESPRASDSKLPQTRHIVRSTVVAGVKKPVTTVRVGASMLYQRAYVLVRGVLPPPPFRTAGNEPGATPGSEGFEELLDREGFPTRTCGRFELCIDGPGYFPAFFRELRSARQGIDVQTYIFDNDDEAVKVADLLRAKSAEVPVRVFFDELGSSFSGTISPRTAPRAASGKPRSMARYLTEGSRVKVRRTANPLFVSDHTKLQVIDGKVAFLGGMNIGREYSAEWHDLMLRLEGPIVEQLQGAFDRTWKEAPWWHDWSLRGLFAGDRKWPVQPACQPPLISMRVLRTDPLHDERDILRATLLAIRNATRRVWIETPYYGADDITAELESAVRRGVDVRVIIPGESDSGIMQANNEVTAAGLLRAGARVFKYHGVTHLKAMICDDWALLGSANCDTLSLRINRELDIAISNRKAVQKIADAVFVRDFRRSQELSAEMLNGGLGLTKLVGDQL